MRYDLEEKNEAFIIIEEDDKGNKHNVATLGSCSRKFAEKVVQSLNLVESTQTLWKAIEDLAKASEE